MKQEYDSLIRGIADVTNKDFDWIECMFKKIIEVTMEDKIIELENKIADLEKKSHASKFGSIR